MRKILFLFCALVAELIFIIPMAEIAFSETIIFDLEGIVNKDFVDIKAGDRFHGTMTYTYLGSRPDSSVEWIELDYKIDFGHGYIAGLGGNPSSSIQRRFLPLNLIQIWTTPAYVSGLGAACWAWFDGNVLTSDESEEAIIAALKTGQFELSYFRMDYIIYDWNSYIEVEDFGGEIVSFMRRSPVPEPSTYLLLGLGLAGAAVARRKFKK